MTTMGFPSEARLAVSPRPFTQPRVFALQLARQIRVWPLPARPLDSSVTRATSSLRFAALGGGCTSARSGHVSRHVPRSRLDTRD